MLRAAAEYFGMRRADLTRRVVQGLGAVSLLILVACNSMAPVVKVGLVAPFEGRHREIGYDVLYSARLAVREINAAGGIEGTRVALVTLDDSGSPEFAAATADSLLVDPEVVAVVGNWLPKTTAVAQRRFDEYGLAYLAGGEEPFEAANPADLTNEFVEAYMTVSPFDETPGPYAGAAYDAFQHLWRTLAEAKRQAGTIDRSSVFAVEMSAENGQ